MKIIKYKLKGKVWLYPGMVGWHFLNVDKEESEEIREIFGRNDRGFGSVPVNVCIGKTKWETSIFPDKKSGVYLLPVKADVRKKENIVDGSIVSYSIEVHP